MRVLLLHDDVGAGSSADERDVFTQMDAIEAALRKLGHDCSRHGCSLDLEAAANAVRASYADIVFNLVESLAQQGRLIQVAPALLDCLGMPYTGCPSDAVWLTSNKLAAKRLMAGAGIATPAWFSLEALRQSTGLPAGRYILKSVWEHASRGLDEDSVIEADCAASVAFALQDRLPRLGGEGFAERYVDGREFNLSLLGAGDGGCRVMPPAEIVFEAYANAKPRVVGYRAKWDEESFEYHHTPRRFEFEPHDAPLLAELKRLALECWTCFGLRGYARVDFRVDGEGRPWVLEVNTNPCLSPDAGFAAALERAGIPFQDAIARILADCMGRRS